MVGRRSTGTVTLRAGNKTDAMEISVPALVAKDLKHLQGRMFACELTEDGILFRLLTASEEIAIVPAWARAGSKPAS